MWETWVQFLGSEDTLEKEKATHSSILLRFVFLTELYVFFIFLIEV